jgi:LEA14-like dessication related protein
MAEIKLTYDSRNKVAKNAIQFILSLGLFNPNSIKIPNTDIA